MASLTRERLAKYLAHTSNDLDAALALYEINTEVSEAFYTSLQFLEICLRNKLHVNMANTYGSDWFRNGKPPLSIDSLKFINDAVSELVTQGSVTPVPGQIVAQLRFAFWVRLMGPSYDNTLWRRCLHRAFPNAKRKRSEIQGRFNAVRRFRNRIAHHEPILWRPTSLEVTHDEILDAIGWMCANTSAWARPRSAVPYVIPEKI